MPCQHRFLGLHLPNSLLPNWETDYLFIGTFNPEWVLEGNQQAQYYYGRTQNNYFWWILASIWNGEPLNSSTPEHWIPFLQHKRIGITDLLLCVNDANIENQQHQEWIKSMADADLAHFNEYEWNTPTLCEYLQQHPEIVVFVTNLGMPQIFEAQLAIIGDATKNQIIRLPTPSKRGINMAFGPPLFPNILDAWHSAIAPFFNHPV